MLLLSNLRQLSPWSEEDAENSRIDRLTFYFITQARDMPTSNAGARMAGAGAETRHL